MLALQGLVVTSLMVAELSTQKSRPISVKGRAFHSISYRYEGEISLDADGARLLSPAGSVTFMPASLPYTTEVLTDTRMIAVHFYTDKDTDFRTAAVITNASARLRGLFEALAARRAASPTDFSSMALLYEILSALRDTETAPRTETVPQKIRAARDILTHHYADPLLDVTALAAELSVSTAYLRRAFGRAYGQSPIAFLKELRLSAAKGMLASEFLTVAQIAAACGYNSVGYFIDDFRRAEGVSPGRYRARFYAARDER